ALRTSDESTTRATLAAIAEHSNAAAAADIVRLLDPDQPWPLRRLAAQTLHRIASAELPEDVHRDAFAALQQRVRNDANAFVREACLRALVALAPNRSRNALETALTEDVEARVRDAARSLLEDLP